MNESQKVKWERTRARGFWRFVLLYWVLLCGGSVIVITSLYDYFLNGHGLSLDNLKIKVPIFLRS
jgi:hypothetical protein